MNRALRAAAVGVLLIAPVALSACSAGQVNQTSAQSRDKVGATARIGNITLRQVELAFPSGGSYAAGSDAVLNAAIVNEGDASDTLVSITGDGFAGVTVTGTGAQATFPTGGAAAAATGTSAAPTESATGTSGAEASGTETSGAATTTAAPLPSEGPSSDVGIKIPGNTVIYLGQNAPHVSLSDLSQSMNAAQAMKVTFTFQRAGAVTLEVLVASPSSPVPNSSTYSFEIPTKSSRSADLGG